MDLNKDLIKSDNICMQISMYFLFIAKNVKTDIQIQ